MLCGMRRCEEPTVSYQLIAHGSRGRVGTAQTVSVGVCRVAKPLCVLFNPRAKAGWLRTDPREPVLARIPAHHFRGVGDEFRGNNKAGVAPSLLQAAFAAFTDLAALASAIFASM